MDFKDIIAGIKDDADLKKRIFLTLKEDTVAKEIVNNEIKINVEKAISDRTSEIYNEIDKDIFETLGTRKKHDEKTFNYLKELLKDYKEVKESPKKDEESEVIKKLKEENKVLKNSGEGNNHWKQIHEEAIKKAKERETELLEQIGAKDKEYKTAVVLADLKLGLGKVKIREEIPSEAVDAMVKIKEQEIIENAKIEDGKVRYYDKEGKPIMDKEFKSGINSADLWKKNLGALVSDDSPKGGNAPTNPSKSGEIIEQAGKGGTTIKKLALDPEKFSTKVEFNNVVEKVLRDKGIEKSTAEYKDLTMQAYKDYEVEKLDLQ